MNYPEIESKELLFHSYGPKKWHDEHLQKYWKYQDILTVLRTMDKNDKADDIIKEYKILGTFVLCFHSSTLNSTCL
jgi:hypothetical protein